MTVCFLACCCFSFTHSSNLFFKLSCAWSLHDIDIRRSMLIQHAKQRAPFHCRYYTILHLVSHRLYKSWHEQWTKNPGCSGYTVGIILPSYTDTYRLFDLLTSTPSATYIAAKLQWYIDLCVGSMLYVGGWFAHFGWAFVFSENSQSNMSRKKGLPVTAEKRNLLVGSLTLSLKIDLSRGERDVTMEVFMIFMWQDDVPFFKLSEKFGVSFKGEIYQNYSPVK